MSSESSAYVLLDGALLGKTQAGEDLRDNTDAIALYQDLGTDAARVGPWLFPAHAATETSLEAWRAEREEAGFGIARLHARLSPNALADHLHRLRHVHLSRGEHKRYFLRYADHRALGALWPALSSAQQAAVLGPIETWTWLNLDGQTRELTLASGPENSAGVAALPLRLQTRQIKCLLDESRIGDLLAATMTTFPELAEQTTLAQRYAAARATRAWTAEHCIQATALQMTVLVAAARSECRALRDPEFTERVRHADASNDPAAVLTWSQSTSTDPDREGVS